ncbi:YggN family protein [Pseudoxanthomonas koreensis]|uniref:YggN family protein n=1 Tax=Pseudoxanthomonas koreensis TaxID=266061 RepID=UPI001391F546|nr:YggN family protein [Pseudoxanthomonas koreensis]KAF1697779.1 hypothetical protein CSC64_00800 [Pseudoxanthomonas koreensis]
MDNTTRNRRALLPALLLACTLPIAAHAAKPAKGGVEGEISSELAQARKEVSRELAAARAELENGNLELGNGMHFGKSRHRDDGKPLPKAEITPDGDFLIEGEAVAIDTAQRRELLAYRAQVIDIANAGIDIGERSAQLAIDAVDRGLFSLMFSAMTGSLERRIEKTVKEAIEPGLLQICDSLPALMDSQQRLATRLPQFRPYATLEADDVNDCADDMRSEFATL